MFVVVTAEPELDVRRYLRKLDVRWFVGAVLCCGRLVFRWFKVRWLVSVNFDCENRNPHPIQSCFQKICIV